MKVSSETSLIHERTDDSAPRSLHRLLSRFDVPFAHRLYSLHEVKKRKHCPPDAAWTAIGGLGGLYHLLSQGRLITRILRQIRREYPNCYGQEMEWVRGTNWALFLSALGAIRESAVVHMLHPEMTRIASFTCAELFSHLSAEMEAICMDLAIPVPADISRTT